LILEDSFFKKSGGEVEKLIQIIALLRVVVRMEIFLQELPVWMNFKKTFSAILHQFMNLLIVLFSLYFIYSSLGERYFGGLIDENVMNQVIKEDDEIPFDYIYINFNDFGSCFVMLFGMMTENNWQLFLSIYAIVLKQSPWIYIFFLSFYMLSAIVIVNLCLALIIDIYTTIEDNLL